MKILYMSHRTQITLTDEQYRRLKAESRRTGVGLAELIRRAIDRDHAPSRKRDALRALDESFGAWSAREDDGEQYVERLRCGPKGWIEPLTT